MSSKSESGHARSIANLKLLNTQIMAMGTLYNPSNPILTLSSLQAIYTDCVAKQETVNILQAPYSLAVDNREILFSPFSKLVTKIKKAYKVSVGVTPSQMEDITTIARQLQGKKKPSKKSEDDTEEEKKEHSSSQMSYNQRTDNLDLLISLLENTEGYNPNETEYKVATLKLLKEQMLDSTQAVADTFVPLNNARTIRDKALYYDEGNLIDAGNRAKEYLFTILDPGSSQYKAIKNIKFIKPH